jgi:hypothetical protein
MLPTKFQRRRLICEKLTDDEREVIGRGVRGSPKNASPRLSSTSCYTLTWPPQVILVSDWPIFKTLL